MPDYNTRPFIDPVERAPGYHDVTTEVVWTPREGSPTPAVGDYRDGDAPAGVSTLGCGIEVAVTDLDIDDLVFPHGDDYMLAPLRSGGSATGTTATHRTRLPRGPSEAGPDRMGARGTMTTTVERLTAASTGSWLVTTAGSPRVWDFDAMTYTRLRGPDRGQFVGDGETHRSYRVSIASPGCPSNPASTPASSPVTAPTSAARAA